MKILDIEGEKKLATKNLTPGLTVYGERLVEIEGVEYRLWEPYRSKLAAALLKGLQHLPVCEGSRVLYLGVSTGTTASHISDIIGEEGDLFCVEAAPRVAREFVEKVGKPRRNIFPIIEDARKPLQYIGIFGKVDLIYCDIAQPDQTYIAILNCERYLKPNGHLLLVVKSRSIDVTKSPGQVFLEEKEKLQARGFHVIETVSLEPFQKSHALIDSLMK